MRQALAKALQSAIPHQTIHSIGELAVLLVRELDRSDSERLCQAL